MNSSSIFLKSGEIMTTSNAKTPVQIRAGSITGYSINYDLTVDDTGNLFLDIHVGASTVWSIDLAEGIASNKTAQGTQARGTDTFIAGDKITVSYRESGVDNINIDDIIVQLEVYYD